MKTDRSLKPLACLVTVAAVAVAAVVASSLAPRVVSARAGYHVAKT